MGNISESWNSKDGFNDTKSGDDLSWVEHAIMGEAEKSPDSASIAATEYDALLERLSGVLKQLKEAEKLLGHVRDILIGRSFTDPLVEEIQVYFINNLYTESLKK